MGDGMEVEVGTMSPGEAQGSALAVHHSEVDVQIATAKKYPRSLKEFMDMAMEFATFDEEVAGSMSYSLKKGKVRGPSVRLAEICAAAYGNLRFGYKVLGHDGKFVSAEGFCFDLERNIAFKATVKRRITTSLGATYSDDMIQTTGMAAGSIAVRNAIFKIIPVAFVSRIEAEAKKVALGEAMSLNDKRTNAFAWYASVDVTEPQVLAYIERRSLDEVTLEDLLTLRGLRNAIKEGVTTVRESFPPPEGEVSVQTNTLNDALADAGKDSRLTELLKHPAADQALVQKVTERMGNEDYTARKAENDIALLQASVDAAFESAAAEPA